MEQQKGITQGVRTLLGDPRKAILKLSAPTMIGMLSHALYNIADGVWVAGLGADQLAAVGLFFPFFMIIIALGAGIGVGGSSAVSRRIGKGDKAEADNTAIHTFLIGIALSLVISLSALPFLPRIFMSFSGSENIGRMAASYGRILFGGTIILVFSNISGAILRGEGDAKRSMYGMLLGSCLNIILDPVFIYLLDMGVVGAAWATVISMGVTSLLFSYWLFFKKNTYLDVVFGDFQYNRRILGEVLEVGIPSSLAQLSMSIAIIAINKVVIMAGGTDGVAVLTSGWRILMVGTIPLIGVATGVVAVTGAAYGAGDREKLKTAFTYAVKVGLFIELTVGAVIFIFAEQLSHIFTYSEDAAHILDELVSFLHIMCLFYPMVPLGMLTSAMFRGVGEGRKSLMATLVRTIILQIPCAYLLGINLGMGLRGVWWGMIVGNAIAVSLTFLWGIYTVKKVPMPVSGLG